MTHSEYDDLVARLNEYDRSELVGLTIETARSFAEAIDGEFGINETEIKWVLRELFGE
jgi:hypothetical protein